MVHFYGGGLRLKNLLGWIYLFFCFVFVALRKPDILLGAKSSTLSFKYHLVVDVRFLPRLQLFLSLVDMRRAFVKEVSFTSC